jgi:hypothetical protein
MRSTREIYILNSCRGHHITFFRSRPLSSQRYTWPCFGPYSRSPIPPRQFLLAVTFFVTSGLLAVGFFTGRTSTFGRPRFGGSFTYDLECVFYKGASQQVPGYFGHVNCSQLLTVLLAASLALMLSGWFNYQDENAVEEEVGGRSGDRSEQ